jgi:hypothetical protein
MSLNDPERVRREYATETRSAARRAGYTLPPFKGPLRITRAPVVVVADLAA